MGNFFTVINLGLNLVYGYLVLNDQANSYKCIEILINLNRYLEKDKKDKISFKKENEFILNLIKLLELKRQTNIEITFSKNTKEENIYIRRFSIISEALDLFINDNINSKYNINYMEENKKLNVTIYGNNNILKSIFVDKL